jgi:hypothetical protein
MPRHLNPTINGSSKDLMARGHPANVVAELQIGHPRFLAIPDSNYPSVAKCKRQDAIESHGRVAGRLNEMISLGCPTIESHKGAACIRVRHPPGTLKSGAPYTNPLPACIYYLSHATFGYTLASTR